MFLTITTDHQPASDLGYLLHKHPDRFQTFNLSFGKAHVFYPETNHDICSACLVLDVDSVGLVRGKSRDDNFLLGHYVNDRPYVCSSFMSVAIAQVFRSAMAGRCVDRPELVARPIPLTARLEVLPVRIDPNTVNRVFEPLGYSVQLTGRTLDDRFPEWGASPYFSVIIRGTKTLSELLTHLYVLIPVFDNEKHYFVGEAELEKLLSKGTGWLANHPEKDLIAKRYLRHRPGLYRQALDRLLDQTSVDDSAQGVVASPELPQEQALNLHQQRHSMVIDAIRASDARSVLDLGCGEGKLLRGLLQVRQFEKIVGMDVSIQSLEIALKRLKIDQLPERQAKRIQLIHGSLMYRDRRLEGYDAAAVVEVIEHLDPPRLHSFVRVLFEFARPRSVFLTTPNREYNTMWPTLPAGKFRHADHRFEWTRHEFENWASQVAQHHGYSVRFAPIGPVDESVGPPTQMAIFELLA
jgi:3' terminal RNA ribose 2'-O-methyltransferase Hen1